MKKYLNDFTKGKTIVIKIEEMKLDVKKRNPHNDLKLLQELLALDDIPNKDTDDSPNYSPEVENTGTVHPMEEKFFSTLLCADRSHISDFGCCNMINWSAKAYGIKVVQIRY